jgi:hypothetical protein
MQTMNSFISIPEFVTRQEEENRRRWYAAGEQLPGFAQVYTLEEKRVNQKRLNEQMDWLTASVKKPFRNATSQQHFSEAAGQRLKVLGMNVLGLTFEQLSVFESEHILDISRQFFKEAQQFDPRLSTADIFQASRNVWTSVYLQILLGFEASLTPAIFAYSLLYPVTDNFLDDPKRLRSEKVEFNQHFCTWLKGQTLPPLNEHETRVLRLIRLIEGQYPREAYPQVYESLLAIFHAQQDSLLLPKAPVAPYSVDVLGVTLRKGGTSVLADGVLAAGELTIEQMQTIFDYGCFAQFMDDQEDAGADRKAGALTVFSEAAAFGKLDLTMNRLFAYSRVILKELDGFMHARSTPLIQVSLKGIDLLLIDACMRTRANYSRTYLSYLETFFPVSFVALGDLQRQIKRRNLSLERLLNAFWPPEESPIRVVLPEVVPHPMYK